MAPWEYLWIGFNTTNFGPIFDTTWRFSLVMILVSIVFYNFQGRRLRNYAVFLDLNEWLLWTSLGIFSLLIMYSIFGFDFIFVLPTMVGGAALYIWIRFVHFRPLIAAYEERLARQRYFQRSRTSRPEATIRKSATSKAKRRRR
jgi:membrane protease YdiL (CAAX protease family)